MDAYRFDAVARSLAGRRLSRRAAVRSAGQAGLAAALAGVVGAGGGRAAAADEAAESTDKSITFMFVQSFKSGTLTPASGDGGYALTLSEGLGQTIYFSDRPERVAGTTPTKSFLASFPFDPDNPPNAALVLEAAPGDADVVVLELTAPTYDEATHTASYAAKLLADDEKLGITFQEEPKGGADLPASFGAASLFIDDCPDANPLKCFAGCEGGPIGDIGDRGMCWSWSDVNCVPCQGGWDGTADECDQKYADCNNGCFTNYWGRCF